MLLQNALTITKHARKDGTSPDHLLCIIGVPALFCHLPEKSLGL